MPVTFIIFNFFSRTVHYDCKTATTRSMWIQLYIICFILFTVVAVEFQYPADVELLLEDVQMPEISQEDIKNAFVYSRKEAFKRLENENQYIKAGYGLSDQVSPDGRLFSAISDTTMQLHRVQEQFEDATKYLVEKYNLTIAQATVGLQKVALPDNEPLVQQCNKLREIEPCDAKSKYRTLDGSCNNLDSPHRGKAYTCFRKLIRPTFTNGFSLPRISKENVKLPSPRLLSAALDSSDKVISASVSQMFLAWGQFLVHDISHNVPARAGDDNSIFSCCQQNASKPLPSTCLPIDIPETDSFYSRFKLKCMSFVRSAACSDDCKLGGIRHTVNQQSSFIDGSVIYGVKKSELKDFRTFQKGQLRVQQTAHGHLLPISKTPNTDQCSKTMGNLTCFQAGDSRVNTQPGLTTMHTIWVRQHNKVAEILAKSYPSATDEVLFQETRRIVSTQIQHISFKEFLPFLLGPQLIKDFQLDALEDGYTQYDPSLNPTVSNEQSTDSLRFGHGMVRNTFSLVGKHEEDVGELFLRKSQDHPMFLYQGKLDSVVRGLYHQPAQEYNPRISSSMFNHLLETPGGLYGLDLQAITIQRGRDQGLPSYTDLVKYCLNISIATFEDLNFTMAEKHWKMLSTLYRNVEDVDSQFSCMETHLKGSLVGPVTACVNGKHFHNLKFGDRFYYEHGNQTGSFTQGQLKEIKKTTLARIICDNSDNVDTTTPHVLRSISPENEVISCEDVPGPDLVHWLEK